MGLEEPGVVLLRETKDLVRTQVGNEKLSVLRM
jgi:hypothetical protein